MPRYQLTPEDRRKGGLKRGAQQRAAALARRATEASTRRNNRSVKSDFFERDLPKGYKWKFDKSDFSARRGKEKGKGGKPGKTYVETEYIITIRKKGSADVAMRKGVITFYGDSQSDLLRTILATNGDLASWDISDISWGDVDDWLYDDLDDFDYGRYGIGGEE